MKIAAGAVERFARKPDPAAVAALVYGPDEGLVRETAEALVRSVVDDPRDPFRVAELSGAQLRDDPARLADEAAAIAFTGGRRVVRVRGAGDALADAVAAVLDAPLGDALIVLEAGELGPRSRLRLLCEGAGNAAALACYGDDPDRLGALVESVLGAAGVRLTGDARQALLGRLGGDRSATRGELEKLALYAGAGGTVDADDVLAVVGDGAEATLDDLVYALGDGDVAALHRALDRTFAEGTSPIGVLRAAIRHFLRLHQAGAAVRAGAAPDQVLGRLRPPVFYKLRPRFRAQMERWPAAWIEAALDRLLAAEIDCKTTGMPDRAVTARVLLELTRGAARGRARRR